MPNWKLKSALHHVMARLPEPQLWNRFFQTYITRSIEVTPERCLSKLQDCRDHLEAYRKHGLVQRDDFRILDLGTGWVPVVPIGFFLCGARRVWTIDIVSLLTRDGIQKVFDQLIAFANDGTLQGILPVRPERMDLLRKLATKRAPRMPADQLRELQIEVIVDDASQLSLPDESCDLIVSVDCVDQIPASVLPAIFAEFRRVISPQGVMSHRLEMRDLYSYFDHSLSPLNFLQYSQEEWSRHGSPLTPQNRLRITDYRQLCREATFEIAAERNSLAELNELLRINLNPQFRSYSEEDLLVTQSWMTALPA